MGGVGGVGWGGVGWRFDHSVSKSPKELWSFGVLEFGLDFGLRLDFCLTISVFQEMIICADIDEDGKISFDEFKKLMLNPFS